MNVWSNPFVSRANTIEIERHNLAGAIFAAMDPYAKPNERRVGANRPKISHLPSELDKRTRNQRRSEKQAVAAERRAIRKAARRQLKKQLIDELNER